MKKFGRSTGTIDHPENAYRVILGDFVTTEMEQESYIPLLLVQMTQK